MKANQKLGERTIAAGHYSREKDYWLKRLSGEPVKVSFPYDFQDKDQTGKNFNTRTFRFCGDIHSRLLSLSKGLDYTLHMILTAALTLLLDKYNGSGNKDIIVSSPIYHQEIEADFVNTVLALRNYLAHNMTFKDLLLQVRQTIAEATENQNYPIDTLLYQLDVPLTGEDFPLFDTAILVENIHDKKYLRDIHFNMIFSFLRTDDYIDGSVEYNSLRYKGSTIERIVNHFSHLLEEAIFNLEVKLPALSMMTAEEKQQVLFSFNETTVVYPRDKQIHRLFAEQAQRTPDHTALVGKITNYKLQITNQEAPFGQVLNAFGVGHLTYKELDKKSHQLARILQTRGLQSGAIVGLMIDDSVEMIIGILGILKAGGAYLPISPGYPFKRVLTLLEDSNAPILLTREDLPEDFSYVALQGFAGGEDRVFISPSRPPVKDLDSLQVPDRSSVDYEKYSPYIAQAMVKNSISLQFSRGCVYNCAYCFKIWSHGYVNRSAGNIFEELRMFYNMGIRRFAFVDDLPNFNVKESTKLFDLIVQHGLEVHLHFPNGIRGDILSKDYIDLMVKAGTVSMDLALETSSPRLQKLIRKNLNLERLRENMEYIIKTYPHVILGTQIIHGLPSETREEARESLEFIKSLKWLHFPYIHLLTIYPNTDMAQLARDHGISREAIGRSANLGYHEIPETMPFPASFTRQYQAEFMDQYFMNKERLMTVLPWQMRSLTEDELVQKYNNYLPMEINSFSDLLSHAGISGDELKGDFLPADFGRVPGLNQKIQAHFPVKQPRQDALRVLLLDLSLHFSSRKSRMIYNVVEPPLGLMYLLTQLRKTFGNKLLGKIAKSRIDFDDYEGLKEIMANFKPDVIGIRSLNFYKEFFHKTIALLRQWGTDVPIIAGGPYATSSYATMLKDANIDLAVWGEGEITFAEIIGSILANKKKLPGEDVLKNIAGIAFMERQPASKPKAKTRNREILLMDRLPGPSAREPIKNLNISGTPGELAYIIYTSGSTGIPKGVMVQHNNLVNQVIGLIRRFSPDASPPLNYIMLAPFTFDVSVMHIFLALLTGGKLYLMDEKTKKDSNRFWQLVHTAQIDILNIVPAFMRVLLNNIEKNKLQFKYLFVGGDVFPWSLYRALKETFKTEALFNIYGPTETTINALLYQCSDKKIDKNETIPIGKPLTNYRVYILDDHLEPVPVGLKGEICISGESVSRGYLNRPELTAETFLNCPRITRISTKNFNKKFLQGGPGGAVFSKSAPPGRRRLYKTGDLGRWLGDGNIEFLGRIDRQVKIRGFRIELGEIQKQLMKKPGLQEVVVIAREDKHGEKNLYAYIVCKDTFDVSELREFLSGELPEFMVPSYFIRLDKIPLTSNGTVDIKALPDPQFNVDDRYEAPRDEVERKLVELWAEVLEVEANQIGISSNFFELGGHSLRATILVSKIHKALHVKLPLAELFRTPFIRELARYIKGMSKDKHTAIDPVEKKEYLECSFAQKRLYIEQQIQIENISYNMSLFLLLEGELDCFKLETIFNQLIQRHENLRTSFQLVQDEPVQRIHNEVEFEIEYHQVEVKVEVEEKRSSDLEGTRGLAPLPIEPETGNSQPAAALISSFIRPFNLFQAPLLKVGLMKIEDKKHFLLVDMHHIITDGISTGILIKEFMALYSKGSAVLPALRIRYQDFSQWQDRLYRSEEIKKQEDYWVRLFEEGVPVLNLPLDYPHPSARNFKGEEIHFEINSQLMIKIKKMVSETETTLHMVLLAVFTILMSKYSGQEDIIVGCGVSGRRHADLENVIGMFVNLLPMRNQPRKSKSFLKFLEEVKSSALDAYENQDYPFEELVKRLNLQGKSRANPLFDVVFQTQNVNIPELAIEGLTVKPYEYRNKTTHFDLIITAFETPNTIDMMINYSTELFKPISIEKIGERFIEVLEQALENREIKLKEITLSQELVDVTSRVLREEAGDFEF